jgi:hypothetical protein
MPGLTKKKKIKRVLKQVADPTVADVMTTTEEFDEDEFDESRELLNMRGGFREPPMDVNIPVEMPVSLGRLPNQRGPSINQINNLAEVSDHAGFDPAQFLETEISVPSRLPNQRGPGHGWMRTQVVEPEDEVVDDPVRRVRIRGSRAGGERVTPEIGERVTPEIVEGVTGLLSIVDTELEGLTSAREGTRREGELSREPFIHKQEVKGALDDPDLVPDPRIYDHYGEDIDGKEQRYLAALGDIYKKVAILNAVAALTNSPSQAGAFMQMASKKFETLEGFRTERRMQKIGKGVFFTEDGEFDAPKTKQEAYERAIAFGASPDEAAAISGDIEETATTTGSYTTWYNTITGETETFRPGFAPVDEEGNIMEGWVKGSKPQGTGEERLFQAVERLITDNPIENFNEAYAQLRRYYLSAKDAMGQLLALRGEEADKMAFAQLRNTYQKLGLSMPTEGGEAPMVQGKARRKGT